MWHKRGLIYAPSGDLWWAKSYALLPTVDVLNDDVLRIYYASLDEKRHGRIGYVDVDAQNPKKILNLSMEPVLDLGDMGCFDDSGVNPSAIITVNGKKYLYYIGWQRCENVPYMLFSGLAWSGDGGQTFQRMQRTPILDRSEKEPFSRGAFFVTQLSEGDFLGYYWSCTHWSGEKNPHYNNAIHTITSSDGIVWPSQGKTCISPSLQHGEYSVGRPWVVRDGAIFKMWYSIRSTIEPYKLGYAVSSNGLNWVRKDDQVGIFRSKEGWDSEMVCYPCVVDVGKRRYLFYNGNQYGSSGFGYAEYCEKMI